MRVGQLRSVVLLALGAWGVIHCGNDETGGSGEESGAGAQTGATTGTGASGGASMSSTGGSAGVGQGGQGAEGGQTSGAGGGAGVGGGGGNPWANLPVGQCVSDSDCPDTGPSGAMCNRSAPGGICLACGASDANCPSNAECNQFGSCSIGCSTPDDCPPGQTCAGNGLCRIAACAAGVCPVPWFGCNGSNLCTRLPCDGGQMCPAATTCTNGLCIEDHAL